MDPAEDVSSIQHWEEQAAHRVLDAPTYADRRGIYREIYSRDNSYWLQKAGRYGMSGQCSRNHDLLRQAGPGNGPVLDVGGGLGLAAEAFEAEPS